MPRRERYKEGISLLNGNGVSKYMNLNLFRNRQTGPAWIDRQTFPDRLEGLESGITAIHDIHQAPKFGAGLKREGSSEPTLGKIGGAHRWVESILM